MKTVINLLQLFFVMMLLQNIGRAEIVSTPTPQPTPSVAQLQRQVVGQVKGSSTMLYNQLMKALSTNFELIWSNPNWLTPQQVFDAFGTDACQLFTLASATATYLNTVVPNSVPASALIPPQTYTINSDCTVTSPAASGSKKAKLKK